MSESRPIEPENEKGPRSLARTAVLVLLVAVACLGLASLWMRQTIRGEIRTDLPAQLTALYRKAEDAARQGDRYTAYLLFRMVRPFRGTLFEVPGKAEVELIRAMRDEDCRYAFEAHERVAEAVRATGEPALTLFLLMVSDERVAPGARAIAVRILFRVAPDRLREALLQIVRRPLDARQRVVTWEAAVYLGYLGGDGAAEALVDLTERMRDWGRQYPIISLKRLGAHQAVPAIEKALSDPCTAVRRHAARALGRLGEDRAVVPLRVMLETETDPLARSFAEEAIRRLSRPGLP